MIAPACRLDTVRVFRPRARACTLCLFRSCRTSVVTPLVFVLAIVPVLVSWDEQLNADVVVMTRRMLSTPNGCRELVKGSEGAWNWCLDQGPASGSREVLDTALLFSLVFIAWKAKGNSGHAVQVHLTLSRISSCGFHARKSHEKYEISRMGWLVDGGVEQELAAGGRRSRGVTPCLYGGALHDN